MFSGFGGDQEESGDFGAFWRLNDKDPQLTIDKPSIDDQG